MAGSVPRKSFHIFSIEHLSKSSVTDNGNTSSVNGKPTIISHYNRYPMAEIGIPQSMNCVTPVNRKRPRTPDCDENLSPDSGFGINSLSCMTQDSMNSSFETSSEDGRSECDSSEGSKRKKARTAFSKEQIDLLEKRYKAQKYLSSGERNNFARKLKLSDQQVKTWFQNRRMKEKRNYKDDNCTGSIALPTGGVDISQLAALGIPLPPHLSNAQTTPMQLHSMSSPNVMGAHQGLLSDSKHSTPVRQNISPFMSPMMFGQYPGLSPIGISPFVPFSSIKSESASKQNSSVPSR